MDIALHPKQAYALLSTATEILFGGAAAGGKSHLMRVAAITWAMQIPGLQTYIFRRHHGDLHLNHMCGPSSFPNLLAPLGKFVRIVKGKIHFGNGSTIHLCHCQHEKDLSKYQGAEIHVLLMDELTHFTESMYRFLRSRVRIGSLSVPPQFSSMLPRILAGTNPGSIGHNWVKATFVTSAEPYSINRATEDEGGMMRQFIPARLLDNPSQDADSYKNQLKGMGSDALVKAMLNGDWDIVAGGALDDVWSENVIKPRFKIPPSWRLDRSFDWGSTAPFSVLWFAQADGTEATLPDGSIFFPRPKSLIVVQEWYGAAKANKGLNMTPREIAQGIASIEDTMRLTKWISSQIHPGPADNSIESVMVPGTPTIGEMMRQHGISWMQSDKSPGSRIIGLTLTRELLTQTASPSPEHPGIYIMSHCRNLIANLPVLPRDPKNLDDVDSAAEDHDYDALRYRVLAQKPAKVGQLGIW